MKLYDTNLHCQVPSLEHVAEGLAHDQQESFTRRSKLAIRRCLPADWERYLKTLTDDLMNKFSILVGRSAKPAVPPSGRPHVRLQAGDLVRVRSLEEIEATLNNWKQLRGCAFMPEMAKHCGTTQRVWKRMERFVDERDLRVKKSSGIILLEGLFCEGTAQFGSCDRSCFVFWREEWLEKLEDEAKEPI